MELETEIVELETEIVEPRALVVLVFVELQTQRTGGESMVVVRAAFVH